MCYFFVMGKPHQTTQTPLAYIREKANQLAYYQERLKSLADGMEQRALEEIGVKHRPSVDEAFIELKKAVGLMWAGLDDAISGDSETTQLIKDALKRKEQKQLGKK